MSAVPQSENEEMLTDELREAAPPSDTFDRNLAAKVGKYIAARRILCALSQQQLGTRLGISAADMRAYEQGATRMNCKLLLATANQLNVQPRYFFQDSRLYQEPTFAHRHGLRDSILITC